MIISLLIPTIVGNVPLSMLNEGRYVDDFLNIKHFPMVTIAQWYVSVTSYNV